MNKMAMISLPKILHRLTRDTQRQPHSGRQPHSHQPRSQQTRSQLLTQCLIAAIFISLIVVFLWSLDRYWQNSLQPRLYKVAETQAKILAESQTAVLVQTLERTPSVDLKTALINTVQQMLIVEDPAIGERFIRHVKLEVDYDTVNVPPGSLDLNEGEKSCSDCFQSELLLTSHSGEILGLATLAISDAYFRELSSDMKNKLFAESSIVVLLVLAVWVVLSIMFYRLHAAKQLVEASDLAKTRFMANVTHELRTPLNAILGYTQLYKQDAELMQLHRQGIETIDRSADHLLLMINDILEFSRANEESLSLHPEEVGLTGFLNTLVEMTRVRTQLKGLQFHYEFSGQLPAIILTDEKRLRQILLNLLGNAVKFTEQGSITFQVTPLNHGKKGSRKIRFSVRDSGIGIERHQLKNIFIPFQQLDNAITRAEGTGLGLTISQRLLKLMHTRLQVSSKPGDGSHFWFVLDLATGSNQTIEHRQSSQLDDEQAAPMSLPEAGWIQQFREQVKRHNILGIRQAISQLQKDGQNAAFLEYIQPYISQYQFRQLLSYLDELEAVDEQA